MIKSMTGYGKAEATLATGKLSIEIRTLNGKTADINLKSSLLPKDKELEVRSRVAARLQRGTIDIFLSWEAGNASEGRSINMALAREYIKAARTLASEMGEQSPDAAGIINAVLRMPDVVDTRKTDILTDADWPQASAALDRCLDMVDAYRTREGKALYADVSARLEAILSLYDEVEEREAERMESARSRILKAAEDLAVKLDASRLEQEMIYYLEKYDINEEKVRLRQHCRYFRDTLDTEACPGKKLGFIIQEMGREINTTGSKAGNAGIQALVVRMKDELEKMREQSMNIL